MGLEIVNKVLPDIRGFFIFAFCFREEGGLLKGGPGRLKALVWSGKGLGCKRL